MPNRVSQMSKKNRTQMFSRVKSRLLTSFFGVLATVSLLSSACRADEPLILSSYRPAMAAERLEGDSPVKSKGSDDVCHCECPEPVAQKSPKSVKENEIEVTRAGAGDETSQNAVAKKEDPAPKSHGEQVDINLATSTELISLPGIGPATAEKIINYREKRRFRKKTDLMRVRGIGRATMRKLESLITVSDP